MSGTFGCLTCRLRRKKCPANAHDEANGACSECQRLGIACRYSGGQMPNWLNDGRLLAFCVVVFKDQIASHRRARSSRRRHQPDSPLCQPINAFINRLSAGTALTIPPMSYGPSFDPYTFLDQWAAVYGREQLGHIAGQDLSLTRHPSPNADKIGAGTTAQSGGRTTVPTVVAPGPLIAPINRPPVTMLNGTGSSAPASQFDHTRYPQTLPGGPVVDDSLPNVDRINATFISSPSGAPTLPAPDPSTNHMSIPILFGDPQQVPLPTHSQPPAVLPTDQILVDMTALVLSRVPPVRSVIFVMEDRDAYHLGDRFRRLRTPLGVGVVLSAGNVFDYMRWDHIPHGNPPYSRANDGPFHSLWS